MTNLSYEPLKTYSPYPNKKRRIIIFLVVIALVVGGVFYFSNKQDNQKSRDKKESIEKKGAKATVPVSKKKTLVSPKTIENKLTQDIKPATDLLKNIKKAKNNESEILEIPDFDVQPKKDSNSEEVIKEQGKQAEHKAKTQAEASPSKEKKEEGSKSNVNKPVTKQNEKNVMPKLDDEIIKLNFEEADKKAKELKEFIKKNEEILDKAKKMYDKKDYFGVHEILAEIVQKNNLYTGYYRKVDISDSTVKVDSQIVSDSETEVTELTYEGDNDSSKRVASLKLPFHLWLKMARIYSDANTKTFFSSKSYVPFNKTLYQVQRGDALQKVAKKFNSTVAAIQKQNGMDKFNFNIRVGENLNVYNGQWRIVVNKSKFLLMLFDKDNLFSAYSIALGKNNKTPIGNFKIVSKVIEPDWYSGTERIAYGDERNVLGTRWMEIKSTDKNNKELKGYGVHGTWERDSINKMRSNGCVRMLNENVEELFDIIPLNTPIKIIE
ncbi:L,D-transpeptidase family protein [Lentisphaerota bacterium WC36G]|nr:L,D-transpeptidase family protein [Lentisphaerae bacterium WC36]